MRRRLVQSTLAVAVVAVALLGIPLAVAGVVAARVNAQQEVERAAGLIGSAVEARFEAHEQLDPSVFDVARLPDSSYAVVQVDDRPVLTRGAPQPRPVRGEYQSAETYVRVDESGVALRTLQLRVVALVLVLAVVALAAALALGLVQARRLAAPLVDLAARARRFGSGETRPSLPRYGIGEVDAVALALDSSAERTTAMLAAERQFASDASHQLRTPLTALSMRLEEILNSDDPEGAREEARIALGQVERLTGVVDTLLSRARQSRSVTAVPLDVDAVVEQQVLEWRPAFAAAGRDVEVGGVRGVRAVATPGGLAQVLATLLENSLQHGAGRATVRVRTTGLSAVVEVTDEGPGVPAALGPRVFERAVSGRAGTGLGLALARDLAEADGGRLELVSARPPVFAVFLALADEDVA
ncbi:MAG: sensor histidine kinase [Motilibacteraceae bacterium]